LNTDKAWITNKTRLLDQDWTISSILTAIATKQTPESLRTIEERPTLW